MSDREQLVEAMARWLFAELKERRRRFLQLIHEIATARVDENLDSDREKRSILERRSA